ncbi:hypothetical protein ACWDUD_06590 [Rhodococcus sp. NPDC003382]|nr:MULTISPECIES: hypothetical protein [unclassified Rhodococcus (in: high G+C Gram-positive bacteria)]
MKPDHRSIRVRSSFASTPRSPVAYPVLPGVPGLTPTDAGEPD